MFGGIYFGSGGFASSPFVEEASGGTGEEGVLAFINGNLLFNRGSLKFDCCCDTIGCTCCGSRLTIDPDCFVLFTVIAQYITKKHCTYHCEEDTVNVPQPECDFNCESPTPVSDPDVCAQVSEVGLSEFWNFEDLQVPFLDCGTSGFPSFAPFLRFQVETTVTGWSNKVESGPGSGCTQALLCCAAGDSTQVRITITYFCDIGSGDHWEWSIDIWNGSEYEHVTTFPPDGVCYDTFTLSPTIDINTFVSGQIEGVGCENNESVVLSDSECVGYENNTLNDPCTGGDLDECDCDPPCGVNGHTSSATFVGEYQISITPIGVFP